MLNEIIKETLNNFLTNKTTKETTMINLKEEIQFLLDKINDRKNAGRYETTYEFTRLNKILDIGEFFEAQNIIIEHLEKYNYKLKIDKNSLIIKWER